ncbi:alpha/beta fold hydrolase [Umboniibacter marinipuniceus]|uniref:Epoxide hydrolase n=1 Tax=Umboniibacter marinipuniceus TaxID=569599 RepID=A0A3M0A2R7_9GAMM|nr:alpha/beta fold hydrolase [Umboniibacter marinipuniceus]RMA78937.1 epoxide hydrolase [Umboniibacter marinipuniceus]
MLEKQFSCADLSLAGVYYPGQASDEGEHLPVIALHGWLDNAASFHRLAPLLAPHPVLALDLAGHGQSDHRPASAGYSIWADISDVLSVANQMGWERFALVAHSRGAAIATLITAVSPQRVAHLAWLDGGWPMLAGDNDFVSQLRESVADQLAEEGEKRAFPSFDHAVIARRRGLFKLSESAARVLTERGTRQTNRGFEWSSDRQLMAASPVRLMRSQMEQAMAAIECDIQLFYADCERTDMNRWRSKLRELKGVESFAMAGEHHLHMESAADEIAQRLIASYQSLD